jgi:hypothetical protein
MPLKLHKIRRAKTDQTKTATVEFAGESMQIDFRPSAMSPATLQAVQDEDTQRRIMAVASYLDEVLSVWDVQDERGKVLPIDKDTLLGMPLDFLMAIVAATTEAVSVPKESASSSFTG